jgi:hypothetical protein
MNERVYIEWYDAYTLDSWQPVKEATEMLQHKYIVKTTAWLLEETEGFVSVCHSHTPVQIMGCLHIPKECIVKMEKL